LTDFEKAILFAEYLNTANFVFSNFLAVLFAMVAASYFLAHRMTRPVASLFLIMYSIGAIMAGAGMVFAFADFSNLGAYIHETTPDGGGDLRWLGPTGPAGAGMKNLPGMVSAMAIAAYTASIAFFFIARRQRLAQEDASKTTSTKPQQTSPSA